MKYFTALTVAYILLIAGCTARKEVKSWTDINYANDTMTYHKLDIYLPEVSKNARKYKIDKSFIGVTEYSSGGHGPGLFEEKYFRRMIDFFIRESSE